MPNSAACPSMNPNRRAIMGAGLTEWRLLWLAEMPQITVRHREESAAAMLTRCSWRSLGKCFGTGVKASRTCWSRASMCKWGTDHGAKGILSPQCVEEFVVCCRLATYFSLTAQRPAKPLTGAKRKPVGLRQG